MWWSVRWGRTRWDRIVNGIVLGALAVMWIVVLSWEGVQGIREGFGRRGDSLSRFRRQLDIMSKQPYQMSAANRLEFEAGGVRLRRSLRFTPVSRFEAARRRRDVVFSLGTLVAAGAGGFYLTFSSLSLWIVVAFSSLFAAYSFMVVRRRQLVAERAAKVRYLPSAGGRQLSPIYARRRAN